jgi:subtilisin family serine protease
LGSAGVPNDTLVREQWALDDIQAPAAWSAPAGAPVVVAVIDTGVDLSHPDLRSAAWTNPGEVTANGIDDDANGYVDDVNGWDFVNGDASVFDSPGADAHGTHVAGILAAARGDGFGTAGVAANVRVMVLKFVVGDSGSATHAIEAIRYARANGARIVNASFAGAYSQALCDAVAEVAAAGVLVVAAAGNEGMDLGASPYVPASCAEPSVIGVGATDIEGGLAAFSNHGTGAVDISAPGELVLSTSPGAGHTSMSGTSMAAPHVSGVAALVLGANPQLTPGQARQRLLESADHLPSLAGQVAGGAHLNAARALGVPPSAQSLLLADAEPDRPSRGLLTLSAGRSRFRADRALRVRYRTQGTGRVRFVVRDETSGRVVATFSRAGTGRQDVLVLTASLPGRARALSPGRYRLIARMAGGVGDRALAFEIIAPALPAR